ncbi:MAG: bifunctional proline dehydrogenase/L-glutamate gamma-semialdehyde dehydrogenase PutA, partial [Parvularculaceae bacterium]|nr:bifunctional proline dehydrogenase/L-glutamate gamma-semialdehyde dehydrogenase PutA [Parvularculaceae bacterium]
MRPDFDKLRQDIRAHHYADEATLAPILMREADIGGAARKRAQEAAAEFVRSARAEASRSGLIDKFLQQYGLTTHEGVLLMRLAEALLRTPDAATADALIKDKVEAGDWRAHKGKSPFPLVNVSTRALMLTAAWLDDVEGKDPTRQIVRATKALLDRVGEPVIRASVGQAMKIMGEHFVLGETIGAAQRRARDYGARGYTFSFDMLGEAAYTDADARKYFEDYAAAIAAIGDEARAGSPEANPGISVKLSALHPRYEYAKRDRVLDELGGRVADLARAAKAADIGFNIDAEEAARLDLSLDLIERLARDPSLKGWDGLGVVVQAYQRRARPVIDWLAALARDTDRRMMVRLVKGAYWDGEIKRAQVGGFDSYPVYTRKVLTDISYQACARKLFAGADVFYPQFATHNALTAAIVHEMAGDVERFELQRLHGMGDALHDRIVAAGGRSRIYAPVGGHRELLPYLVRRLLENGANSSFVNQLFDPDLAIDRVVADPLDLAGQLNEIANTAIPAPRDLFGGARLSAQGFDLNDPATAARLVAAAAQPREDKAGPLVGGRDLPGAERPVLNPSNRSERVGTVLEANAAAIDEAVAAAAAAQPAWEALGSKRRGDILRAAADLLEARTEDFVARCAREAGKTLPDGIAEVREAVDFLRYYADEGMRVATPALGVVACISPWNFPLAIFLGQIAGALAAGNAVVAKPAEQTPLIAYAATKLLHEAGVPPDVLHLVPGDGPSVGAPLTRHPRVAAVVFTGSTEVAQRINQTLAAREGEPLLIAETGGVNAMIVDSTALLEQAVADAVAAAFQSAGQRCSAARLVCVQEDVADRFCAMLAGAMAELEVGDP